MKRLLFILIISLITVNLSAQFPDREFKSEIDITKYNFIIDNNATIVWRHIYTTPNKDLDKSIPLISGIKNISKFNDSYLFELEGTIDYKKYGGKYWSTPIFLNYHYACNVIMEFKDTCYRATVKDLNFYELNIEYKFTFTDLVLTKSKEIDINAKESHFKYINLYFLDLLFLKPTDSW